MHPVLRLRISTLHNCQVLHGWFTDPQPFFTGGLSAEEAEEVLNTAMAAAGPELADVGRYCLLLAVAVIAAVALLVPRY
jgi:hypothetical protein